VLRLFISFSGALPVASAQVNNVSSFWGGSSEYSPLQTLGPQDVFIVGDSPKAWSPLTQSGTGGLATGAGQGLTFKNNPDATYAEHGWTEYIELEYAQPVTVAAVAIGENRGNMLLRDGRTQHHHHQSLTHSAPSRTT
jgi:hypothetical protein